MKNSKTQLFHSEYPSDLYDRIIEDGAGENIFDDVYRIATLGINNRDAFLSTYFQGKLLDSINIRDIQIQQNEIYDIGDYSTSCFDREKDATKLLEVIERHGNAPCILKGKITPNFGLSMYTKHSKTDRKGKRNKHHIDWWIYKDVDPSVNFHEIEVS